MLASLMRERVSTPSSSPLIHKRKRTIVIGGVGGGIERIISMVYCVWSYDIMVVSAL